MFVYIYLSRNYFLFLYLSVYVALQINQSGCLFL